MFVTLLARWGRFLEASRGMRKAQDSLWARERLLQQPCVGALVNERATGVPHTFDLRFCCASFGCQPASARPSAEPIARTVSRFPYSVSAQSADLLHHAQRI